MKTVKLTALIMSLLMVFSCTDNDEVFTVIGGNGNEGNGNGSGGNGGTNPDTNVLHFYNVDVTTITEITSQPSIEQNILTEQEFSTDYNLLNLIISGSQTNPLTGQPIEYSDTAEIEYQGNLLQNLSYSVMGINSSTSFEYNADNKISKITIASGGVSYVSDISYPSENQVSIENFQAGELINTCEVELSNGRITKNTVTLAESNETFIENFSYSNDNLVGVSYQLNGESLPSVSFSYDNKNNPIYNLTTYSEGYFSNLPASNYQGLNSFEGFDKSYFEYAKTLSEYSKNNPQEYLYFNPFTNSVIYQPFDYEYNSENYPIAKSMSLEVSYDISGITQTISVDADYEFIYY